MKIEKIRHSLAHILAYSIQELYPGTKFSIGPAIENGFYYDFDFISPISENDLKKIEEKMRELIRGKNIKFEKKFISKDEAKKIFKDQKYKLELIKEIEEKKVSIYQSGNFIDLCKGPHIKSTREISIDSFKLIKIAGAYWRGDEKNKMLTRIYGLAFNTKKELDNYLFLQEEAEKRDHRLLGQKLDLFHIDENIGPGLILWHPKGAILKKIIADYIINEYLNNGYQLVSTPHIAKINLWEKSGHTNFYKENMYPVMRFSEISQEEKDDYQIKPMNCPFHIFIYKQKIKSYKDLPLRYTEIGTVYRYERSGTLHGLTRVRVISQDDAHIFCTSAQLSEELTTILHLVKKILKKFGFKDYQIFLSTRPEKYVGNLKLWEKATSSLEFALKKLKLNYKIDSGEGVFYGPKIDIKIKDAIGRFWQCTTIQVDFNLPEKFEINYIDEKGKKQQAIMIHRALLGSLERFIGVLIENYAGAFPFWLSPEQIWIIPISSKHKRYSTKIEFEIRNLELRVIVKDENETVSKKIREGEIQKIPYLLIIGDKEIKRKTISIRQRGKGNRGIKEMKLSEFLKKIEKEKNK
jgi:threonyl-tRNA synthetase